MGPGSPPSYGQMVERSSGSTSEKTSARGGSCLTASELPGNLQQLSRVSWKIRSLHESYLDRLHRSRAPRRLRGGGGEEDDAQPRRVLDAEGRLRQDHPGLPEDE